MISKQKKNMKKLLVLALVLAPVCAFAQKFGHIDSSSIIQIMPEYTQAQSELETLEKQYQDELNYLQEELKKKSEDYQAQAETLPDNVKQRREQELNELYEKINKFYNESDMNLRNTSAQKMQAITDKIRKAIQEVGDEGSYICIFDSADGMIPYVSTTATTDVTELVKAKLGIK